MAGHCGRPARRADPRDLERPPPEVGRPRARDGPRRGGSRGPVRRRALGAAGARACELAVHRRIGGDSRRLLRAARRRLPWGVRPGVHRDARRRAGAGRDRIVGARAGRALRVRLGGRRARLRRRRRARDVSRARRAVRACARVRARQCVRHRRIHARRRGWRAPRRERRELHALDLRARRRPARSRGRSARAERRRSSALPRTSRGRSRRGRSRWLRTRSCCGR